MKDGTPTGATAVRGRVLCQGAEGVQEVCAEAGTLLGTRHHQRLGFRLAALLDQVADRLDAARARSTVPGRAGRRPGHLLEAVPSSSGV